jgi:hypothetical protein
MVLVVLIGFRVVRERWKEMFSRTRTTKDKDDLVAAATRGGLLCER